MAEAMPLGIGKCYTQSPNKPNTSTPRHQLHAPNPMDLTQSAMLKVLYASVRAWRCLLVQIQAAQMQGVGSKEGRGTLQIVASSPLMRDRGGGGGRGGKEGAKCRQLAAHLWGAGRKGWGRGAEAEAGCKQLAAPLCRSSAAVTETMADTVLHITRGFNISYRHAYHQGFSMHRLSS